MIWVHRDPVQAVRLAHRTNGRAGRRTDGQGGLGGTGPHSIGLCRAGFKNTLESPTVMDPRIHHVPVIRISSAILSVRYVASTRNMTCRSVRTRRAGDARLPEEQQGRRYGKFKYSTDVIGEGYRARTGSSRPYRERFGLEIEHRK